MAKTKSPKSSRSRKLVTTSATDSPSVEKCGDHYKLKNSRKCYVCGKVTPIHEQKF